MVGLTREELLLDTFVTLSDTLVEDFDLVEVLSLLSGRCVDVFDAEAAGVMLAGAGGVLRLLASSSKRMRLLGLLSSNATKAVPGLLPRPRP